jgi:hypothetical protein
VSHKGKKNIKFSPRQNRFLELYFGGALLKDAVWQAGYRGCSNQSRCNTAKKILTKFTKNPNFHREWTRERKIARLLAGMGENGKSERQKMKNLRILAALL